MSLISAYERRGFRACILIGLCITCIVVALEQLGTLEWLEVLLYDARVALCQQHSIIADSKVVHIDLDDASLHEIGRWPWKRAVLADLLDEVSLADAKAIFLDIILSEPGDAADDQRLADSVARSGRVFLPMSIKFTADSDQSPIDRSI